MAIDGIIFDLDGTLIDSNAAHVEAWDRALQRLGYRVGRDRIFSQMGKGGDNLVPDLLGASVDRKDGERLRAAEPEEFEKIARERGLRPFPDARSLLESVRNRGIRTAIATSGNQKQLALNEECSGLKVQELVDVVVDADAIDTSKPAPDLVTAAVEKLGLSPAQCAMVGDSPYDAEACKNAGVACLGLTAGGFSERALLENGARAVWRDCADLLDHLDAALDIASPGPGHLTHAVLEGLMREALATAENAIAAGEAPIGAVLASGDGTVLARGFNSLNGTGNPTAHAEIVTFANAASSGRRAARDLVLACTLEPCVMCLGAAMESAVDTVVYALKAPADSGTGRVRPPQSPESRMPRIVGNILARESRALFEKWLKVGNTSNQKQVDFVRQLLALTE